jgi:predicted Ser/Thr protein kinase
MTPTETDRERWRRVTELFHAALERPAAERDAFLAGACGGDAALLADVQALLASHARASDAGFIESPALANDPDLLADTVSAGSAEESLAGRTIGPYRIERQIARGGMGVVYLAEDTRLGRLTALKALPAVFAASDERRQRLRREARAAAALAHPAVATVYALEEIDGALFIASEYIDGHSLREEIRSGPLERDAALSTARSIASALAAAHAHGIVHRDLKPENVMRARDGSIKVLDFGLARHVPSDPEGPTTTRLTVEGAIVGTPGYMPPEQMEGRPVDARADVYAFGVLLHELLTGGPPGSAQLGTPHRSGATRHLESIIKRCLAANPADRLQSGAALVAALEAGQVLSPSTPLGATRESADASPRSPLWWWQFHQLATASLHALLLIGVWLARGWLDRPWRSLAFYGAIAAATADVTMRLNLWFESRVHPDTLVSQLARGGRPILAADAAYALILAALAAAGAGVQDELAAVLLGGAIVSLVSLLLIEPATSRAAFGRLATRGSRRRPTPRRSDRRPSGR